MFALPAVLLVYLAIAALLCAVAFVVGIVAYLRWRKLPEADGEHMPIEIKRLLGE